MKDLVLEADGRPMGERLFDSGPRSAKIALGREQAVLKRRLPTSLVKNLLDREESLASIVPIEEGRINSPRRYEEEADE